MGCSASKQADTAVGIPVPISGMSSRRPTEVYDEEYLKLASRRDFVSEKYIPKCSFGNPSIDMSNIVFVPKEAFLEKGKISPYEECISCHKKADTLKPDDCVLFVCHRRGKRIPQLGKEEMGWLEGQFSIIESFLKTNQGANVTHVWIDYCCIMQDPECDLEERNRQTENVQSAIFLSDIMLIIPGESMNAENNVAFTDLEGMMKRGWCRFEIVAAMVTQCDIWVTFIIEHNPGKKKRRASSVKYFQIAPELKTFRRSEYLKKRGIMEDHLKEEASESLLRKGVSEDLLQGFKEQFLNFKYIREDMFRPGISDSDLREGIKGEFSKTGIIPALKDKVTEVDKVLSKSFLENELLKNGVSQQLLRKGIGGNLSKRGVRPGMQEKISEAILQQTMNDILQEKEIDGSLLEYGISESRLQAGVKKICDDTKKRIEREAKKKEEEDLMKNEEEELSQRYIEEVQNEDIYLETDGESSDTDDDERYERKRLEYNEKREKEHLEELEEKKRPRLEKLEELERERMDEMLTSLSLKPVVDRAVKKFTGVGEGDVKSCFDNWKAAQDPAAVVIQMVVQLDDYFFDGGHLERMVSLTLPISGHSLAAKTGHALALILQDFVDDADKVLVTNLLANIGAYALTTFDGVRDRDDKEIEDIIACQTTPQKTTMPTDGLNLTRTSIFQGDLKKILESPKTNCESLDLSENELGFYGAKTLENYYEKHQNGETVVKLNLDVCMIGDAGVRTLETWFKGNDLSLGSNSIGDAGARIIAGFTTLHTLKLDSNRIGNDGATAIAANTNLSSLHLNDNSIGDEGAKALSENTGIIDLGLSINKITNQGAKAFVRNTTLKTLSLCGNSLDNEMREVLRKVWSGEFDGAKEDGSRRRSTSLAQSSRKRTSSSFRRELMSQKTKKDLCNMKFEAREGALYL